MTNYEMDTLIADVSQVKLYRIRQELTRNIICKNETFTHLFPLTHQMLTVVSVCRD